MAVDDSLALSFSHRAGGIEAEVMSSNADVLCFEEVDRFEELRDRLAVFGFKGWHVPNPGSPCLQPREGQSSDDVRPDGLALFVRTDVVDVRRFESRELRNVPGYEHGIKVAFCAVLCPVEGAGLPAKPFLLACAHLKAKKGYTGVRQRQASMLLDLMRDVATDEAVPLESAVVCGDWNDVPHSAPYTTMLDAGFASAYATARGGDAPDGENSYTTDKIRPNGRTVHTIDYIFHGQDVKVQSVWRVPNPSVIPASRLPCREYPSDHLSLCAELRWR